MPQPRPAIRVLVVDDEPAIRRFLCTGLRSFGYAVDDVANGGEALRHAVSVPSDVVVLDLGLPDMDGLEVLRRLREWSKTPILVLSVRDTETEKIRALDAGADDFITKPFSLPELMARMRATMRRVATEQAGAPVLQCGALVIDFGSRLVSNEGREVHLSPKEYDLLTLLVRNSGKILTHRQIMTEIWGNAGDPQNLRVLVGQVRRKIEADPAVPRMIIAEPGVGYRLVAGATPP